MSAIAALLSTLGITSRLWQAVAMAGAVVVVAGALLGGYLTWKNSIWKEGHDAGYTEAINAIAAQDGRAIGAAKDARVRVHDCRARGLRFKQSTGECGGR